MKVKQTIEKILDSSTILGLELQKCRQEKEISLSRLSIRAEIVVSNLRSIERGEVQPSIGVAIRLLNAMSVDISRFFMEFALLAGFILSETSCAESEKSESVEKLLATINDEILFSVRSPFGILFHEFRTSNKVTQKFVSEAAKYGLRNILDVEKGKQEPSTLNALAMVCAVAQKANVDIDIFFRAYQEVMKKSKNK